MQKLDRRAFLKNTLALAGAAGLQAGTAHAGPKNVLSPERMGGAGGHHRVHRLQELRVGLQDRPRHADPPDLILRGPGGLLGDAQAR